MENTIRKMNVLRLFFSALLLIFLDVSCASVPIQKTALGIPYNAKFLEDITAQWLDVSDGIQGVFIRIRRPHIEAWALRVDLSHPSIEIVMNAPSNSNGVVAGIKVSDFLRSYNCIAAVNAGPFSFSGPEDKSRRPAGIFISAGVEVSPPDSRYSALVFYRNGTGAVIEQKTITASNKAPLYWAAGGFSMILDGGEIIVPPERTARHPRSAAGVSKDGQILYLLVIDGRRPGSAGATEMETAFILRVLGAAQAVNMDGGGSTSMALLKDNGVILVNRPAHSILGTAERNVGVCIGVRRRR
ncbi:MAG: phosphodiester glycosidase family protein [Spirochaetaceae bacterium]|jgi:exopolysaccharide biosynthesis protein|nr:phosphodiester glycosidase family protein [Spirochaetaceae bacterium]